MFILEEKIDVALFQQEGLVEMKKKNTKRTVVHSLHKLPADVKTDWKRVRNMTEEELEKNAQNDPDTMIADENFWKVAKLVMPNQEIKERITIRIDKDVLNWFKHQGRGYQSRINAILRAVMNSASVRHKKHKSAH